MAKRPKIQYGTPAPGAPGSKARTSGTSDSGPIGVKIAIGAAVLAVVIAIVVFAVQDSGGDATPQIAFQSAEIEGEALPRMTEGADPAVGMTIPTVNGKSFDGSPITIEPGEPQVIAFLAHWCPHCQAEVPLLVEWQQSGELKDDVKLIGVSTSANEAQGNFPPASWLEREEWDNPTMVDTPRNAVLQAFGVAGFPTLIAVKADGTVAQRASGELALDQVQQLWDAARGEAVGEVDSSDESSEVPTTDG